MTAELEWDWGKGVGQLIKSCCELLTRSPVMRRVMCQAFLVTCAKHHIKNVCTIVGIFDSSSKWHGTLLLIPKLSITTKHVAGRFIDINTYTQCTHSNT